MAAVTICSDFGAQENKISHHFHCFPFYLSWSDEIGFFDLSFFFPFFFWLLSFKPAFSLFSFTFIKRLFSFSSLSAITVVLSFAFLRLLMLLPAILIAAHASYSSAFHMMYPEYKLNKQGDDIQPCHTPLPILNQSVVPCLILTVAPWPSCRFLRRWVRWSGIPISWRIFYSVLWSTQSETLT